jgi:hypothetical protein
MSSVLVRRAPDGVPSRRAVPGTVLTALVSAALAVAMAAVSAAPASAQFGPGVRAMGMGGAFVGLARGFEAVYWNPANLGLSDRPDFSLGLAGVGATAGSVGPELFDFDVLADPDPGSVEQADFLADVPATGAELRGDMVAPWLALSAGPVAVGFSSTVLTKADVSRELVELYLDAADNGELDGQRLGSYRVGDTGYRGAAYSSVTAAYAVAFTVGDRPASVGFGLRGVLGHHLERGRLFEPTVENERLLITGVALRADAGIGFGVDLGASYQPVDGLTLGLAVENVVQRMHWDEDVDLLGGEFTSDLLDDEGLDGVLDEFDARPFDPASAPLEAYLVADELLPEAYFPRVVRLGAGYRTGGTSAGVTYSSTVGGGDLHAGWPSFLAVGVEQDLVILALRGGWVTSLDGAHAFTLGTGLGGGGVHFSVSGARFLGSQEGPQPGEGMDGQRYADRLAAGSGFAVTIGLSVLP